MEENNLKEDDSLELKNVKLRCYQTAILNEAVKQNSIVFLPTGAGKTMIAIGVLLSKTPELTGNFPEEAKRAFFVSPTKILVHQLCNCISIHTKFTVGVFVGDMLVELWDKKRWDMEFQRYQVIILTGEILRQLLEINIILPSQISLIVFDECHHATLQHPYRVILQILAKRSSPSSPLLLGLTAVLLNGNPKKRNIMGIINDLKNSFRASILSATEFNEVGRFAATPDIKLIPYHLSISSVEKFLSLFNEEINILSNIKLKSAEKFSEFPKDLKPYVNKSNAQKLKNWFENAKDILQECGIYCGALAMLYYIILVEKVRLMSTNPEEIQVLVYCRTVLYKLRRILLGVLGEETSENIYNHSSNKIQVLLSLLKDINRAAGGKHFAILIFVRTRVTAIVIASLLKTLKKHECFSFLKPEYVVGSTIYESDTLLQEFKNNEITQKFGAQVLNTIVSTNVLEEGVDISHCNVVISFDFPVSYASFFQSRGRARNKNGLYYIFVKNEELAQKEKLLQDYKQIEIELAEAIKKSEGESNKAIFHEEEDEESSLNITAVFRYCSKLPQDKYSFLSPSSWYKNSADGKTAYLLLPSNSPIKGVIEGKLKCNKKLAKKSVFSEAVKKLKEIGELDEFLNPLPLKEKTQCFNKLFPHFKEDIDQLSPPPASKKRTQTYEVKFAKSLSGCLPQPGRKSYLHVIDFTMRFQEIEREDKLAISKILESPVTFAILSSKKLFKICQFPLFLDMGQINCNLLINHDEVVLSKPQLHLIKLCHFAVFQKVLKITKNFQVFDNRNKEHSFYVVPVKKTESGLFVLDWEVIGCDFCGDNTSALVSYKPFHSHRFKRNFFYHNNEDSAFRPSDAVVPLNATPARNSYANTETNPRFVISHADYNYFVISPNYRNVHPPQLYIVSKICADLSPLSPFPRSDYVDYFAYYQDKYDIEITNVYQPLLKVAFVFTCSNFNNPKCFTNQAKVRNSLKNNEELLVPELCDVFPFDRRYWLKALLIPTALNRICHLYCVEEFRRKIVQETGLGRVELPTGAEWKPLEINLRDNGDTDENKEKNIPEHLDMALPLSQLKGKIKSEVNFVDLNRNIEEVGVCDLEYLVGAIKKVKSNEEILMSTILPPRVDEKISHLKNPRVISIPSLTTIKGTQSKLGPDLAQLVQTFTSSAANDIVSYERLEILGDAFLKLAVTTFLFKNYKENEGTLTFVKGKLVGNRNLLYCGLAKGFQYILNVTDFAPMSDWNPPLFCLPEKLVDAVVSNKADPAVIRRWDISPKEQFSGCLSNETLSKNIIKTKNYEKACDVGTTSLLSYKSIKDKMISDSVEALIGAYLWEFGMFGGFEILTWLGILPKDSGSYSSIIKEVFTPHLQPTCNEASVKNILSQVFYMDLEEVLGYRFKNNALLLEAISHPTFSGNRVTDCYQRLEFLGDAILDFLITSYIYQYCGERTPGQITDIRSSLVNNITFASLAVRYEFHKYLLKTSSQLNKVIEDFVLHQINRNYVVDDNVLILLEENDCSIAEAVQAPKALGDIFESLAGAIYLDSGNSLETVWSIYYRLMKNEIDNFTKTIPKTPVRLLYEICPEKPHFEFTAIDNTMQVSCTVWYENTEIKVYGFGKNFKEAKRSAAKIALRKISQLKSDESSKKTESQERAYFYRGSQT